MSTKALRSRPSSRSARSTAEAIIARAEKARAAEISDRLANLKAVDMPWLSDEGLKVLADAPEVSGPAEYEKPAGWR